MGLFDDAPAKAHPLYLRVRDGLGLPAGIRELQEQQWKKFKPHADPDFPAHFPLRYPERSWELHLGSTFLDGGYEILPNSGAGADFDLRSANGARLLVEAIAASRGKGVDRVVPPSTESETAAAVPVNQIVLRVTAALRAKYLRREDQVAAGSVDPILPYVIAVNVGQIDGAFACDTPPLSLRACLGFGQAIYEVLEDGLGPAQFIPMPAIQKLSGASVETTCFFDPAFSTISGILLSDRLPGVVSTSREFEFLNNHNADTPVFHSWLPRGNQYWADELKIEITRF